MQPFPRSNFRTFSSPKKETLCPLAVIPNSYLTASRPRQLLIFYLYRISCSGHFIWLKSYNLYILFVWLIFTWYVFKVYSFCIKCQSVIPFCCWVSLCCMAMQDFKLIENWVHFLAIKNNIARSIVYKLVWTQIFNSFAYLGVEFLTHVVTPCLAFWRQLNCFL